MNLFFFFIYLFSRHFFHGYPLTISGSNNFLVGLSNDIIQLIPSQISSVAKLTERQKKPIIESLEKRFRPSEFPWFYYCFFELIFLLLLG